MVAFLLLTLLVGDGPGGRLATPYTVDQPPPPPIFGPHEHLNSRGDYRDEGFHVLMAAALSMSSDTAFPRFIGPTTNPWLAKDPRSLSEARLLGVYTLFPNRHPWDDGQSYLLQIRAAINNRWSVFLDKSGYSVIDRGDGGSTDDGWNNLAFGAKYVLIRDVENQFLLSAGVQYEAPTGEASVFQRPSDGSITAFLTAGKEVFCFGHILGNVGVRAPLSSEGCTLLYSQLHVDYGVTSWLYPLVEVNYYRLLSDGRGVQAAGLGQGDAWIDRSVPQTAGSDLLTVALGVKARYSRNLEAGIAYEKSITGTNRLLNHRFVVELVMRY
jgi:hypothetical protein